MKLVTIRRVLFGPHGTFGVLDTPGCHCWTVECPGHPWVPDNKPGVSCIPPGRYKLVLGVYHHNTPDPSDDYPAYEVMNVPGREYIKIHRGNRATDVKGCIALGQDLGELGGMPAVLKSSAALATFMAALGGDGEAELLLT